MFKEKDFYRDTVKACMAQLASLNRGDVWPWEHMEATATITRQDPKWSHLCKKLRTAMLKERGITMWPVFGTGYKLATTIEQANMVPEKLQRRAVRRLTRAIREVEALPESGLPVSLRRIKHYRTDSMRMSRRLVRRAMREQGQEVKRTETGPRRVPQGVK